MSPSSEISPLRPASFQENVIRSSKSYASSVSGISPAYQPSSTPKSSRSVQSLFKIRTSPDKAEQVEMVFSTPESVKAHFKSRPCLVMKVEDLGQKLRYFIAPATTLDNTDIEDTDIDSDSKTSFLPIYPNTTDALRRPSLKTTPVWPRSSGYQMLTGMWVSSERAQSSTYATFSVDEAEFQRVEGLMIDDAKRIISFHTAVSDDSYGNAPHSEISGASHSSAYDYAGMTSSKSHGKTTWHPNPATPSFPPPSILKNSAIPQNTSRASSLNPRAAEFTPSPMSMDVDSNKQRLAVVSHHTPYVSKLNPQAPAFSPSPMRIDPSNETPSGTYSPMKIDTPSSHIDKILSLADFMGETNDINVFVSNEMDDIEVGTTFDDVALASEVRDVVMQDVMEGGDLGERILAKSYIK
jgi:hypothetical protein